MSLSNRKGLKFETEQNYYALSSIQLAGGNWGIPVMAASVSLYLRFGLGFSLFSIFLGNLLILIGYYYFVKMSSGGRLNAVQNIERFFGIISGKFFAFIILISMIGWLALGLERLSQGLDKLSFDLPGVNIQIVVGCLAAIALLFGVKGLRILSCFLAPVILAILLICFIVVGAKYGFNLEAPRERSSFSLIGIIPIVVVLLDSILEYPTFYQHSKSLRHSITSLLIVFLGTVIGQVFIIYIGQGNEESAFTLINPQMFDNLFLNSLSATVLILGTLGASAWNIYAASIGWESLFPRFKDRTEYAVIGLAAIILFNALPVKQVLGHIVELGAILIVSAVVIMLCNYLMAAHEMKRSEKHDYKGEKHAYERMPLGILLMNNFSWVLGSSLGVLCKFQAWFHDVDPLIISFVVSGGTTFILLMAWEVRGRIKFSR